MQSNKYKFARRIAVGGMAEVLLARQQGIAGFEKLVVIKRILPQLREDGRFVQMFLNEARLAASLHHPNIVEIFDVARDADDFFIVMEYLSGEDLRVILKRARREEFMIPVGIASRIISDAAIGLDYAHRAVAADGEPLGIVHRDVAPTNIIVSYTGAAKLLDFGVAKANVHNIYTKPGTLKGKYGYASPEQVQHKPLDARSDVFSLAIVLWELLTVRRLFAGKTPAEVLKAVMERRVPPPSAFNDEVPEELDRIVLAALERDRDKRTPSSAKLAEELEHLLEEMNLHVGPHQVGSWMQAVLAEQHDERRRMEQEVVSGADFDAGDTAHLPAAFSNSLINTSPSASVTPGASVSDFRSHASQGSNLSHVVVAPPEKRKTGLVVLLSVLLTLLFVGVLGVFFLLGRGPQVNTQPPPATTIPATQVAFMLQVNSPGAKLVVDGKPQPMPIGADGLLVPVTAGTDVRLQVSKQGFVSQEQVVKAPQRGTKAVFINLARQPGSTQAVAEASAPEPDDVVEPDEIEPAAIVEPAEPSKPEDTVTRKTSPRSSRRTTRRRTRRRPTRAAPPPPPAAPQRVAANVVVQPEGAAVKINGVNVGTAPIEGYQFEVGRRYTVQVSKQGFEPYTKTFEAKSSSGDLQVSLLEQNEEPLAVAPPPPPPPVVEPPPPVAPPPTAAKAPPPKRDITLASDDVGSAKAGRGIFGAKCKSCHSNVRPADKASKQWVRYFRYGNHTRHARLDEHVTASELADVKAYLMQNAADKASDKAAGVR